MSSHDRIHLEPRQTWLPLATVVMISAALITMVWSFAEWKAAISKNTAAITELSEAVKETWTARDMELWVRTVKLMNPDLRLPDAR